MQDRFRFRVWNKKNKEMIYNAEIAYDGMNYNTSWQIGKNTNDGWVDCFGYYLDYSEDYEVMQCTGLKDKNGKLIYEGDIVKSDFDFITNTINPLRFNIGNVIYSDYIAGFVIASDINDYSPYKTSFFGKTEALNCIVIGNIYENPELLED